MAYDTAKTKKCPMCGTMNDQNAQSCSFCGYLFEDYGTGTVTGMSPSPVTTGTTDNNLNAVPEPSNLDATPLSSYTSPSSSPAALGGTALYVVSKSLLGSIIPALVYLFLIGSIGLFSGFSYYSIFLVVIFMLIAIVPGLFSPRRFEFYDNYLKTHKTIGGDSEIQYSELSLADYPTRGRSQQIVLSVAGQRRPIILGKNPTNQQLGMDLRQFLNSKLKKTTTQGDAGNTSQQQSGDSNTGNSGTL